MRIAIGGFGLLLASCSGTTNSGGGGVFLAKDATGDGLVSGDIGKSDSTGSDIGDAKASDSAAKDSGDGASADADDIDSGVTQDQIFKCWQDKCSSNVTACQNSATCSSVLTCVFACPKSDSVCPNKCADPLKNDLAAMGAFTSLANCTKANCNLSNLPANTCGNGKCEGDEINFCSMDCDTTIGPLADCVTGKCQLHADPCLLDANCNKALNCVLECTDPSCWSGCAPTSGASQSLFDGVWTCTQTDCGVYLPQGS